MASTSPIAPVYRYFTADLLTNEIIAEIPFRGVSFECALKAAGKFAGRIPITAETDSMKLHDSTSPGNTALYVMRNGVCVWGGIIWARSYQLSTRDLSISASEFTSYLYHRKIWKTWNHQFGATVAWLKSTDLPWVEDRRNYAMNPVPAEAGSGDDWQSRYSWTKTFGTTGGPGGGRYMRMTSPSAQDSGARGWSIFTNIDTTPGTSDAAKRLFVTAGDSIAFSVYVRSSLSLTFTAYGRVHDGAGNWLTPSFTVTSATPSTNTGWTRLEGTFTSTVSGYVGFGVYASTGVALPSGATIDGGYLLIEDGTTVNAWYYGGSSSTSTVSYEWEDAADSSNSIRSIREGVPGFSVIFDNGSNVAVKPSSTVHLEFYEPANFKYNGYYRVAETPAPTLEGFTLVSGAAVADLTSFEIRGGYTYYYTAEKHGYNTGDAITLIISGTNGEPFPNGDQTSDVKIEAPDGSASNWFRVPYTPSSTTQAMQVIDGTASRSLPRGTYTDVTVTVRLDTYDYIRTLIDSMFEDFVGTDFPNVYIEPGISYAFDVVNKSADAGHSIIKTSAPHGVAPGQAIQVQDVGADFDGEYEVTDTPDTTTIVYAKGGTTASTAVQPVNATINAVEMTKGEATLTTTSAHGFSVGQNVEVDLGDAYSMFSGTWQITEVPSTTTFVYETGLTTSISATSLPNATATVAGDPVNNVVRAEIDDNVVTLTLGQEVVFSAGDSVTIANTDRQIQLGEKSLDAPNNLATVQTLEPHGLSVGDSVTISGLVDAAKVVSKVSTTTSTTMTTSRPHNFGKGKTITISGTDSHKIVSKKLASNVATLGTEQPHNVSVGASITVKDLSDRVKISKTRLAAGIATLTTASKHNFKVNDTITVKGLNDRHTVISKEAKKGYITLTTNAPHNIQVGNELLVTGLGAPFDGTAIKVEKVTATRVMYNLDEKYWDLEVARSKKAAATAKSKGKKGEVLVVPMNVPLTRASGTIVSKDSFYNGSYVVTERTNTTVKYYRGGQDRPSSKATYGAKSTPTITGPSVMNGKYTVTARTASTLSFAKVANNSGAVSVPIAKKDDEVQPLIVLPSVHSGARTLTKVTSNTFTFSQSLPSSVSQKVSLNARRTSIFNGVRTVTGVPTGDRFTFSLPGYTSSVLEQVGSSVAFMRATSIFNGTYTLTAVDAVNNTISYARTKPDYGSRSVPSYGKASVRPVLIVSSFGPYPGNADIGIGYSSQGYTGVNIEPTAYRGFELKSVGEALDAYSDNINGFEYRIDCDYDPVTDQFTKTFVLIPINKPDPPAPGEVAPISRYGADKLVFEYPGGNITEVSIDESAENSATRFFASGETDLGPDVGPDIGIAAAEDLLRGRDGRSWPLLDAAEQVDGVEDEETLYAYAQRYLSEASPPYTTMTVSLNGSIAPFVGDYKPGDWCSLIFDDPFMKMRMGSALEPRSDVMVRKIDSFKVSVPDGVTFPETVSLSLVAEWEVDKRGE